MESFGGSRIVPGRVADPHRELLIVVAKLGRLAYSATCGASLSPTRVTWNHALASLGRRAMPS